MAVVIYRRVGFQAAAIAASKWAWSKPPAQHVRSYLFTSAKAPTCSEDSNQNKLGHQESPAACNDATYIYKITDNENGIEKNDNDYKVHVSELPTIKTCAVSPNFYNVRHKDWNPDHRKPVRPKVRKNIEAFNTKTDPRAFQKLRPEYKSMCYSSEHLPKTSVQEGESILQQVTSRLAPSQVSEFLVKLSYLPKKNLTAIKSNPQFEMLCSCSTSILCLYSNSEIISCLGAFVRLGISPSHPMLSEYEQQFCLRVRDLSTNELLLVADTFRYMSFNVPKFLERMYSCMQLPCVDLSLPQLIQLIYIIGEGRWAAKRLLEKIEGLVLRYLKDINLEEIGVVCLGFFKTGNGISKPLMERFGDIYVENMKDVSNLALVNVLKMFRFTRVDHMPFFALVGQDAYKRIPEMATVSMMHVVLTFASMHILNENLMKAVALNIPDRVSYCRSKDLAKFLWSFGILMFEPPNPEVFYSVFIDEIRKNMDEFKSFPEHLLTCLLGLAFCQQFPLDLIDFALSNFVMQSAKISMFELKKDMFTLAGAVEIECPHYTGNTISPEFRREVTDMLVELSTQDIYTRREVIVAGGLLQKVLGGPEYVKEHMILPHCRSKDFEVHLDVNGKPIAINSAVEEHGGPLKKSPDIRITDGLLSQLTNTSKQPASSKNSAIGNLDALRTTCPEEEESSSEVIKLAIQVTNRNQYLYGHQQLLGLHAMKRRQLSKLGYVVVEVPFWEWFPLAKYGSQSEKLAYLHHKVFSSAEVK